MKKFLLLILVAGLALTACKNKSDNRDKKDMKETSMENMKKDDMKKDDMKKDDMKKDDMKKDDMKKDDMKKDDMKKDDMKKDDMKKDDMNKTDSKKISLSFNDIEGNKYDLSNTNGKKTYFKFWASWCPVCLEGLSELDKISSEKGDYEILSVVSPGHIGEKNTEDFKAWFKGLNYKNIKVLLDENGDLIEKYNIRSTPTNFIIDSNGEVVKVIPGHLEKSLLDKIFTEVK